MVAKIIRSTSCAIDSDYWHSQSIRRKNPQTCDLHKSYLVAISGLHFGIPEMKPSTTWFNLAL